MQAHRFVRSATMYGKSLGFLLPREVALELLKHGEHVCVELDGEKLVYRHAEVCGGERVKIRVVARYGDREYYALTIPKLLADALGITVGTPIVVEYRDGALRVLALKL